MWFSPSSVAAWRERGAASIAAGAGYDPGMSRALRTVAPLALLLACRPLAAAGLGDETSPYLRALGATVPGWSAWGAATLAEAQRADRLLFVLAGPGRRSDCGRPELALFDRRDVADALGRSYLPVGVDTDERPELLDLLATALALVEAEPGETDAALWAVLTPEGWPLAVGRARGDRSFALGFAGHLDGLATEYGTTRGVARARAGVLAAQLRAAQSSEKAGGPLARDVVERALAGLRVAAGPLGRIDERPFGALRLLQVEASAGQVEARRLLTGTLDALAAAPPSACPARAADLGQRLRALSLGYALTGRGAWRTAAEAEAGQLLALRDDAGAFRAATDDERLFALDQGLAVGALALSGAKLGRADHVAAARAAAETALRQLGPATALRRLTAGGLPPGTALLADHAFLAEGLLELADATGEGRWRDEAARLAEAGLLRFGDPAGGFFESDAAHEPLPARPRSAYDGQRPAASAVMAGVLLRLAAATGQPHFQPLARSTLEGFLGDLQRAPGGVEAMAAVAAEVLGRGPAPSPTPGLTVSASAERGPVRATLALAPASVRAGGTLEARITLEVAPGHSVNGHQPPTRDLYGLSLSVLAAGELRPGTPLFPPAGNVPRRFSREPIPGYQGQVTLTLPLSVPRGAVPGPRAVRLRLGFQACTESRCQPPDSLLLEATAAVARP